MAENLDTIPIEVNILTADYDIKGTCKICSHNINKLVFRLIENNELAYQV